MGNKISFNNRRVVWEHGYVNIHPSVVVYSDFLRYNYCTWKLIIESCFGLFLILANFSLVSHNATQYIYVNVRWVQIVFFIIIIIFIL
jgi:hypothetical protein